MCQVMTLWLLRRKKLTELPLSPRYLLQVYNVGIQSVELLLQPGLSLNVSILYVEQVERTDSELPVFDDSC